MRTKERKGKKLPRSEVIAPPRRKPGHPPIELTEEDIQKIESLAAKGLVQTEIAEALGICYDTFLQKKREYPQMIDAIKKGRAKGIAAVSNALFNNAVQGNNVAAQIFYLKARAQWKDNQSVELTGKDGGPVAFSDAKDELARLLAGIASRIQEKKDSGEPDK
jgi:alpha-glucuronidase